MERRKEGPFYCLVVASIKDVTTSLITYSMPLFCAQASAFRKVVSR
jgi:hypothetical protein